MRIVNFALVVSLVQWGSFSSAQLLDRGNTSSKKDFVENGVPFVADPPDFASEDFTKIEGSEKTDTADDTPFSQDVDEDTPVSHEDIAGEKNLTAPRPWKAPDFSGQESSLGYSPTAFAVPKGMETAVKFWIDVYSKYTTDQGVLHDSENVDLVYEVLDFTPISARTDLNNWQKEAAKIKMVKEGKRRVISMLEKFHHLKDPSTLSANEKKIFDYFSKIDEPKKYFEAAKKGRLRFQLGQRDRVIQGIYFSGRYIEEFEKIFREAGIPIELARLPFVESSYNVLARSKVGASGLWQIMPYTMKGFMKRDPAIDLRNLPSEATKLAAKLMRNNFNMLQSWPLAMTGYNHGPSGVLRLTKKYKTRELGELCQTVGSKRRFGFASRNFYASFLAALEVTSNAPKYLGAVTWSQPLDAAEMKTPLAINYQDILRWFDGDDLKAQIFNPHITKIGRTNRRPIPKGIVISVPSGKRELVMNELQSAEALKKARKVAEESGAKTEIKDDEPTVYKVRRGDTVEKIAKKFGVKVQELLSSNSLKKPDDLRVGQVLKIY